MDDCTFCRIANGELNANIIDQDDEFVAFHDVNPQAPVHVLIIPREHIPTVMDVEPEQADLLGRLQLKAVDVARSLGLGEYGFRLVTNCLEGGGQSVFHVHLHLLGGRNMAWPPG
jgi:histidine triad (HIT) family protein